MSRAKNIEFIYMPFVRRGGSGQDLVGVDDLQTSSHWIENFEYASKEALYLYSYVSGFRIGQESTEKNKFKHYVLDEKSNESSLIYLDRAHTGSDSKRLCKWGGLFDLTRPLTADGPICDGGSTDLVGEDLGHLLLGSDFDTLSESKLSDFDCWRIRKSHRFPNENPAEGERFDEKEQDNDRKVFSFKIRQVHCYLFKTGVAILALEIEFLIPEWLRASDSYYISAGMFHLKKVQSVRIYPHYANRDRRENESGEGQPKGISLVHLGKLLASDLLGIPASDAKSDKEKIGRPYLFYYIPATQYKGGKHGNSKDDLNDLSCKSMRANSLVYVAEEVVAEEVKESPSRPKEKPEETIKQKLHYLANCFDINLPYSNYTNLQAKLFIEDPDIAWGATVENLACLVSFAGDQDAPYVTTTFYDHIRHQYQFVFLLLLHQKYYYYYLLNEVGTAESDSVEALEEYREKLEQFNAKFAFSRITEVTQYQHIYELGAEAMALDQLKVDVLEPLVQLDSRQKEANAQRTNWLTVGIALLGLVFAIPGIWEVFSCALPLLMPNASKEVIAAVFLGVCILLIVIVIVMILSFRQSPKTNRKKRH